MLLVLTMGQTRRTFQRIGADSFRPIPWSVERLHTNTQHLDRRHCTMSNQSKRTSFARAKNPLLTPTSVFEEHSNKKWLQTSNLWEVCGWESSEYQSCDLRSGLGIGIPGFYSKSSRPKSNIRQTRLFCRQQRKSDKWRKAGFVCIHKWSIRMLISALTNFRHQR